MANEETKLDKISGVLKVIKFKPNEPIIKYGDNADTFYLVLDGKVGIYRPNYQIKRMTVKQFLEILYNVKNENNILKYNRLIEKNKEFNLDYELLSHINQNSLLFYESFDFFIENDEKIGEFGNGFSFGEMALINNTKRNATIIALNNTECIALDKVDYNHTIREIERERKKSEVKMFKLDYPVFYNWSTMQIMRLFNFFQKISITKGEYLYKQNEMSDSIYMIKKGKFEMFSLISFGWIRDFLSYIINPENNLILELAKFDKTLSEIDLKKLYDKLMNRLQKSPCKYNPYKINKGSNLNNDNKSFYNLLFKK
jgi:CRP-like cAMP-binding protein